MCEGNKGGTRKDGVGLRERLGGGTLGLATVVTLLFLLVAPATSCKVAVNGEGGSSHI